MKPDCPVARRSDYTFTQIPHALGALFIREYHYARGCSKTGVMYGALRAGFLVGVAQWLPPTKGCARAVHNDWKRVLSLTRLAVHPDEPQNVASMLIAAAIRWLRASKRWVALVTFADESQGHTGAIYRATNWIDRGISGRYENWVDVEGRQVSTKCGPKSRTRAQMQALGYRSQGRFAKRRFTMDLT